MDRHSAIRSESGYNGRMPVDQAVSLLVAHCLMRQQVPNDFDVMVAGGENLFVGITKGCSEARWSMLAQWDSGVRSTLLPVSKK